MNPTRIESRPGVPRAWPESVWSPVEWGVAHVRRLMVYLGVRSDGPVDVREC